MTVAFEEAYYDLSARMRELLQVSSPSRSVAMASPAPSSAYNARESYYNVRLPKLDLPKFSGQYDEWFPFHDTFHSIIHVNASLGNIHKLQYLRAALTGDASQVISSLEVSDANYSVAWNLLKERYDNKRVIVQTHLRSIIELPIMTKENIAELRRIADGAARHVQALRALKRPVDAWDDILVHLLSSKLDAITAREWQSSLMGTELPTLKQFLDFLAHRCQVLESTSKSSSISMEKSNSRSSAVNKQRASCNVSVNAKCTYCQGEHSIYQCKQFLALPITKQIAEIRSRKICLNFLRSTAHVSNQCTSGTCKTCSRKHNTLLHLVVATDKAKSTDVAREKTTSPESSVKGISDAVVTHATNIVAGKSILLSTAVGLAQHENGSLKACRMLLDSGSQANFVSRDFLNALGLTPRSTNIAITGINGTATRSTQAVQVKLRSRITSYSIVIDCIVTDRVTDNLPTYSMKSSDFKLPRNIKLADPKFYNSSRIDILVGADVFWDLISIGQIKATDRHPTLQKTRFGWILAGRLNQHITFPQKIQSLHASVSNDALHNQLNKFWQLDDVNNKSPNYTIEEQICEKHFLDNVSRNEQGRYVVKLPLKEESINNLGESRNNALKRMRGLEKRFDRDINLKRRYLEFMHEYTALEHMKAITEESAELSKTYYLPHHCVLKDTAKSTKLRVVFDGSCKTNTGLSLNDSMMVGPVVQDDLVSILIRFRNLKYVLVADITKMYRQILLHPSQTSLHRIFWRDDTSSPLQVYELTTLTYGTSSASYLATRCLLHLAEQHEDDFPIGSLHVKRDFYVDDLLTGADSKSEAILIRDQVVKLLRLGSFNLSKWGSNCPELIQGMSEREKSIVPINKDTEFRILGILWDQDEDTFNFFYKPRQLTNVITKRSILSEVSSLFDPLGILGPIIVIAKIILQDLWQEGIDWDESIPQNIHTKWLQLRLQLTNLNKLKVPRCVRDLANQSLMQVHGFCDASQRAYGACVYIRTKTGPQCYQSRLLCSKSRIAPLKAISLPRLELSAALLLSRLIDKIRSSIDLTNTEIFLWSDSTIALSWIASPSRKWSVFVANRVGEIQRLTEEKSWRHIATDNNPADIISRGSLPNDLMESQMWWNGPLFLQKPDEQWPGSNFESPEHEIPERRGVCVNIVTLDCDIIDDLLNKYSDINKITRILAYCFRFLRSHRARQPTLIISPDETIHSLQVMTRTVQKQVFGGEYNALSNQNDISHSSRLLSLSPFMDESSLIRVGGRLKNSALPFESCHPAVLPKSHRLTKLIIEFEHKRNMHAGVQATMAAVRQHFWPLALRSTTRNIINKCVLCFKAKPVLSEALMGSLPATRVNVSRPFSHCGVDYAGPVMLREGKRRNSRNHKAYIAVFVCFATKAAHLELVSDLTTDAFLAALKRLISRRGKPIRMYSDNATTFVGAQRQIQELYEFLKTDQVRYSIENFLRGHQTHWSFIPPNAPHFGGLWEAAVKSAKFHLSRTVGSANLTFEEMTTILCEIEAILNSRPLVPLSSDPNDLTYLSPGHFLVGSPLNSFPNQDLSDVNTNRLLRWQVIEQMREHFWRRWSCEYLSSLQERHKWKSPKGQQLEPGQLVLIKQQGLAPLQWITGRVEQVQLGSDGVARSASVKTAKGSYVRPLSKLAILPI